MFACIYAQQISAEPSLAELAYSFPPLVEETAPDTAVIDVEGCTLRFGSPYELATEIAIQAKAKAPEGLGCRVNVASAANPDAAIYAARNLKGITFMAPGEELLALEELPIKKLLMSPKSNVQGPKSKNKFDGRTLDVGHSALDKKRQTRCLRSQRQLRRWTLDKKAADKMSALPATNRPALESSIKLMVTAFSTSCWLQLAA